MGKLDDLERLQELRKNGTITKEEFEVEKKNILKEYTEINKEARSKENSNNNTHEDKIETNNKKIINIKLKYLIIVLCLLCVIILVIIFSFLGKTGQNDENIKGFENIGSNGDITNLSSISFESMKSNDENFSESQKQILEYFDNNYFYFDIPDAQKYPQIFKDAKVCVDAVIVKVLKSTEEEFEVLAVQGGGTGINIFDETTTVIDYGLSQKDIDELKQDRLMFIKGKQLEERLLKGDVITLYGRYDDIETKEIDGKSYTLPNITLTNVIQLGKDGEEVKDSYRFNLKTIKEVAEYIFGKDIKINEPALGEDYENYEDYGFNPFYKITLDNQSNSNFQVFNIYKNEGIITYNTMRNGISENIQKRIFVAADFEHYIVSTYDESLNYVYLDYFDSNFKKIWGREFQYNSNKEYRVSPMDYTNDKIAFVIDNDLYLLDIETGENIIEPVIVGSKIRVNMMEDGIVLIGDDNKDAIMKVDYNGKTIFKQNAFTDMTLITGASVQIVNEKMVLCIFGENDDEVGTGSSMKYLVINNDGTIESSTKDIGAGY